MALAAGEVSDNRAFLERYLCLSVPLGPLTYALYYAIYYGLGLVGFLTGWVDRDAPAAGARAGRH